MRVEHRQEGRLALEDLLPNHLSKIERRRVDASEAEIDATENIARVVAHDAGRVAGVREPRRERVEVLRALLPGRKHRSYAVMMRMPAGEDRHPRRKRPRQRDVGPIETGPSGSELG